MGSPGDPVSKSIHASVGGLVWVRRRNGSWWPGRIVGLDELSKDCVVTQRPGTPVKLLGREDASIDWYSLERSKRVKAFRCGEYDKCIEKAKASAGSATKKAARYARRDDAILHALEIESAQLEKEEPDFFLRRDNSTAEDSDSAREFPSMSNSGKENKETTGEGSDSENGSDSAPELSRSGITFEEPNHISASRVQAVPGKRRTPNDSEDDGTVRRKRMRGLEDLGMGVVSKDKVQARTALEHGKQHNASPHDSNTGSCMPNGSAMKASRGCFSTFKRKRSQVANVSDILKRKNRCRPLTQVLESTTMVSVPAIVNELPSSDDSLRGISDNKVSGRDSRESGKSSSMVKNDNKSNHIGVSCENGISINASEQCPDASHANNKTKDREISSILATTDNVLCDVSLDVPFLGEDFSPVLVSCSSEIPDISFLAKQSSHGIKPENEEQTETVSNRTETIDFTISKKIEKDGSKWQLKGKRNSRQMNQNRKLESRHYVGTDDKPSTCLGLQESHLDGYPQCSDQKADSNGVDEVKLLINGSPTSQSLHPSHPSNCTVRSGYHDSSLYDVEVEANARYRPQDVPLVSLVSKWNGKAIVGHPLTVDVLNGDLQSNELNVAEDDLSNESNVAEVNHVAKRKKVRRRRLTLQSRRSSSKSRRRNGLSSTKTRRLSALTSHKLGATNQKLVKDKLKAPVIACVPLKLVFSRINEAVNGSARQTHRATPGNS